MCTEITIIGKTNSVRKFFPGAGKILIQNKYPSLKANIIEDDIYWDGWVKEDDIPTWINKSWLRAEVHVDSFKQRNRIYELNQEYCLKGIVFSSSENLILKIVTRPSEGKELKVFPVFPAVKRKTFIGDENEINAQRTKEF